MYWGEIYPISKFYGVNSVWMACIDHCPLPHAESFNCLNWLGGCTEREGKREDCQGEGAGWEGEW